jgi:hypothetical protein
MMADDYSAALRFEDMYDANYVAWVKLNQEPIHPCESKQPHKNMDLPIIHDNMAIEFDINNDIDKLYEKLMDLAQSGVPRTRYRRKKIVSLNGLDHLDNLVNFMEQIATLHKNNLNLKRKVGYLRDTKNLLSIQNQMITHGKSINWNRYNTSTLMNESILKPKLQFRSQSVGSINVDEFVDIDLINVSGNDNIIEKSSKDNNKFENMFSRSRITSKWEQVKKVFGGKPEPNVKTETISAEKLVRANSKQMPHTSRPVIMQSRSHDGVTYTEQTKSNVIPLSSTVHCADTYISKKVTSTSNAISVDNEHNTNRLTEGESRIHCMEGIVRDSIPTEEEKTIVQKSNYLTVQIQPERRKSTSALTLSEEREIEKLELDHPQRSPRLGRSASFKSSISNLDSSLEDDTMSQISQKTLEGRKLHKSAWGRVKDIIHTRKDSLKRKNKRSHSAGDALPDSASYSDSEFFQQYEDMPEISSTGPSDNSRLLSQEQSSTVQVDQCHSPIDILDTKENFLMEGSRIDHSKFSEEFIRKMEEWEHIKGLTSTSATYSEDGHSPNEESFISTRGQLPPSIKELQRHLSESFSKTVQEWERTKVHHSNMIADDLILQSAPLSFSDCTLSL